MDRFIWNRKDCNDTKSFTHHFSSAFNYILRIRYIVAHVLNFNPYEFNNHVCMPFFISHLGKTSKHLCPIDSVFGNDLAKIFHDSSNPYFKLITRGESFEFGSKLKFSSYQHEGKLLSDLTLQELETYVKASHVRYIDRENTEHQIHIPKLVSRCDYFAMIFFRSNLIKDGLLNFNPKEIASSFGEPNRADYKDDYRYKCSFMLTLTANALEDVMLYCNCSKYLPRVNAVEFIVACNFLQTDYALSSLYVFPHLQYEELVPALDVFANLFGIEHPMFEFLLAYLTSNFVPLDFEEMLNIFSSPLNYCHYLCTNSKSIKKHDECLFMLDHNFDYAQFNEGAVVNLHSNCNVKCPKSSNVSGFEFDYYPVYYLLNLMRKSMFAGRTVRHYFEQSNCYICDTDNTHVSTYEDDMFWVCLSCCGANVHRLCIHQQLLMEDVWYCHKCHGKFENGWLKLHSTKNIETKEIVLTLQKPYYFMNLAPNHNHQICFREVKPEPHTVSHLTDIVQ